MGVESPLTLTRNSPLLFIQKRPLYKIFIPIPSRSFFGIKIAKSDNTAYKNPIIIGNIDNFEIFENNFQLRSKLKIKDKIGTLYINQNIIYNCVPEKGLIKKYVIPDLNISDLSGNFRLNDGSQLFQDYSYSGFGNTFSIYKDKYAIIGTTEGKVIIQHLTDKNAAKGIVNSGNRNYSKFGSIIRTGKNIYINAPELNKLFVLSGINYYE